MKKSTKAILAVTGMAAGAVAAGAGLEMWSRTKFGRSGAATLAEGVVRISGVRRNMLGRDLGRYADYVEKLVDGAEGVVFEVSES
jgi:hypothetical protein